MQRGSSGRLSDPRRPDPPAYRRRVEARRAFSRRARRGGGDRTAGRVPGAGDPGRCAVRGRPSRRPAAPVLAAAAAVPRALGVRHRVPGDLGAEAGQVGRRAGTPAQEQGQQGEEAMTDTVRPCITFKDRAEEAVKFYVSLFPNSKITNLTPAEADGDPIPQGKLLAPIFALDRREFRAFDGGETLTLSQGISRAVTLKTH